MVSSSDPVESFFNSLNAVKEAFSPLESGFHRAAKDLELCWASHSNGGKNLEQFPQFWVFKRPNKVESSSSMKKNTEFSDVVSDKRKKESSARFAHKTVLSNLFQNFRNNESKTSEFSKKVLEENGFGKDDESCMNCLHFAKTWSVMVNNFVQAIPTLLQKACKNETDFLGSCKQPFFVFCSKPEQWRTDNEFGSVEDKGKTSKEGEIMSLELLLGALCDQIILNITQERCNKSLDGRDDSAPEVGHLEMIEGILQGRKADVDVFLRNLPFARVGGVPSSLVGLDAIKEEDNAFVSSTENTGKIESNVPQKFANGLLNIPLSKVERLRSTLSTVSLTELIELVPQLGRPTKDHPDKKKLFSVQDFFRYTEAEGKRFFEELDRDGDGQVTLEDLEVEMKRRRLPQKYARDFMRRTRSHLFSKSFGWKQFLSFMEQKEPTILRAYTTLCLSKSGTLQKGQILTSLKNAGLPANEDNAAAMMRFLNADNEGSISYGHFRNFMLLLPSHRLQDDPRSIWFEAATVVSVPPPVEIRSGNVLKAALAGGLACALSTSLLHPVDTIKTRVQASTLSFPEIISKLSHIGVQGLYRGSIPAILGQFSSHGLRTGIFEANKLVLINFAPGLPAIQVQSIASFCSTILGTAVRIPCEVLKQRLQAGIFDNVGEAIVGTLNQDGLKGFFRGTGATLCREVPFYVAGMGLYAESKKGVQQLLRRELEPWETIVVGALSGGLAAVVTTPFDVMKTRMMTAPRGRSVSMSMVVFSVLRKEGPIGLFKGAVPRFFWIAPLGAMNFAGYELAKKAMDKTEEPINEQLPPKKLANVS